MADNILQVQCFKCQTVYEVPFDMVGQIVECAICSSIFEVPSPIPGLENEIHATFPYVMPEVPQEEPEDAVFDVPDEIVASPEQFVDEYDNDTGPSDKLETSVELNSRPPAVTSTVKLSRSSIGMMPKIEDHFSFDTIKNTIPKARTDAEEEITEITNIIPKGSSVGAKTNPAAKGKSNKPPARSPERKWWQFWRWFRK
ncbi:MAG: hypothetical protein WC071_07725 [Victivallaceae bacterium]